MSSRIARAHRRLKTSFGAAFASTLGGLMSVAAVNLVARIVAPPGYSIASLHTPFAHRNDGAEASVDLPDLFAGESRDIVFSLVMPSKSAAGVDRLQGSFTFVDPFSSVTGAQQVQV